MKLASYFELEPKTTRNQMDLAYEDQQILTYASNIDIVALRHRIG